MPLSEGEIGRRIAVQEGLLDERADEVGRQVNKNLVRVGSGNPDQAAKDRETAKRLKIPLSHVELYREESERKAKIKGIDPAGLAAKSPATASFLANPDNAAVSHDDVEGLSYWERLWRDTAQHNRRGFDIVESGDLGRSAAFSPEGRGSPEEERRISMLQARRMEDYGDPLWGYPQAISELLPMAWDSTKHRAVGGAVGFVGGLVTGPGSILSAGTGQAVGGFISAADTELGNAYLELRDIPGITRNEALIGSLVVGGVNGLLEGTGMGAVLRRVPGGNKLIGGFTRPAMMKMLSDPIMKGIVGAAAERVVRGHLSEFATEFMQELSLAFMGVALGDKPIEDYKATVTMPDGSSMEVTGMYALMAIILERGFEAGVQGAKGGGGMSMVSEAGRAGLGAIAKTDAGAAAHEKLGGVIEKARQMAKDSVTRKRSPETFRDFLRHQAETEDSGLPKKTTIRSEAIRRFLQPDEGPADPTEPTGQQILEAMLKDHPELADQVDQAIVAGTDLVIPTETYFSTIDGTDFGEATKDDTTFWEDVPTPNELKEIGQQKFDVEGLLGELKESASEEETMRVVRAVLMERFSKQAGQKAAKRIVDWFTSALRAEASLRGVSLREWVEQEGLPTVEATFESVAGTEGPSLRERLVEAGVRRVVKDIRENRRPVVPRGTPVISLIRSLGGVNSDSSWAGELRHMGMKPGQKGTPPGVFSKTNDLRLDAIPASEHEDLIGVVDVNEDGYFDANSLLERVSRELAGEGTIMSADDQVAVAEFQREQDEVLNRIEELDLDLETMDDDTIVSAIVGQIMAGDPLAVEPDGMPDAMPDDDDPFSLDSGARGDITVKGSQIRDAVIRFTEASDLSTLLHEGWHLFMLRLERDIANGSATPKMVEMWDSIRAWLGKAEGDALTVEDHEKLAKAGEKYLRDSSAPTSALVKAFEAFAAWLTHIYEQLKMRGYFKGIEVTEELRDVMDHMSASQRELDIAREERGLGVDINGPLAELGSAEELAALSKKIEDARRHEIQAQRRKAVKKAKRKKASKWHATKLKLEAKIRAEVSDLPVYKLRWWLAHNSHREGFEVPDADRLGKGRMNRKALIAMKGQDILKALPRSEGVVPWQRTGGHHPDFIAEAFRYDDTDLMLQDLATAPKFKDAIRMRVEMAMKEQFGAMTEGEAIADEVAEEVLKQREIEILADEERLYLRRTGGQPTLVSQIRQMARSVVARMEVNDANPEHFRKAALKASRDKVLKAEEGDFVGAQAALRMQMTALAMEAELRMKMKFAKRAYKNVRGLKTNPKRRARIIKAGPQPTVEVDPDTGERSMIDRSYWGRISALLEGWEFRNVSKKQQRKRESMREWIDRQVENDEAVAIPQRLINEANAINWKKMTFSELEAIDTALRHIEHMAMRKYMAMEGNNARTIEAIVDELLTSIDENIELIKSLNLDNLTHFEKNQEKIRGLAAYMEKMEFLIDRLDGRKPDGPWRRNVWQPIKDAVAKNNMMNEKYTIALVEAFDRLKESKPEGWDVPKRFQEFDVPGSDRKQRNFTHIQLLVMALNTGNGNPPGSRLTPASGNYGHLLAGEGWKEGQFWGVMESELTKADWEFVQEIWDLFDTLWPDIVAQERRLKGVIPKRVEARKFTVRTKDGHTMEMRGGYFPIAYDTKRSEIAALVHEKGRIFSDVESQVARPMTGHEWTERRTAGLNAPLELNMNILVSHIDRVILDLTHREVLLHVDRITQDKALRQKLADHIGPEKAHLFRPWLQHIARATVFDHRALKFMDEILRKVRINMTVYTLGYRLSTLALQPIGMSNAIGMLDRHVPDGKWQKHLANAVAVVAQAGASGGAGGISGLVDGGLRAGLEGFKSPLVELWEDIGSMSPFMRDRPGFVDRDMRDAIQSVQGSLITDAERAAAKRAMLAIAYIQLYSVDIPTWIAAYNTAIEEMGLGQPAAVDFADSMVSMSQGAAAPMDLNAMQRGSEAIKMWMLFSSYTMTVYSQMAHSIQDYKQGDISTGQMLAAGMFYVALPGMLGAMMRASLPQSRYQLPDEGEDWLKWVTGVTIAEAGGLFPIIRPMGQGLGMAIAGAGRYFPEDTPMQRLMGKVASASAIAGDAVTPGEDADVQSLIFDMLHIGAMLRQLPASDALNRLEKALKEAEDDSNDDDKRRRKKRSSRNR